MNKKHLKKMITYIMTNANMSIKCPHKFVIYDRWSNQIRSYQLYYVKSIK